MATENYSLNGGNGLTTKIAEWAKQARMSNPYGAKPTDDQAALSRMQENNQVHHIMPFAGDYPKHPVSPGSNQEFVYKLLNDQPLGAEEKFPEALKRDVYNFFDPKKENQELLEKIRALPTDVRKGEIGGKGDSLFGLSVDPDLKEHAVPSFTISTRHSGTQTAEKDVPQGLWAEFMKNLENMEEHTGKKLGDLDNPLILSGRSGGKISMPGAMDSILNIGIDRAIVQHQAAKNPDQKKFWFDVYRRFLEMFGHSALHLKDANNKNLDVFLEAQKEIVAKYQKLNEKIDKVDKLPAEGMEELAAKYEKIYTDRNQHIPKGREELLGALRQTILAVQNSWNNDAAVFARKMKNIPADAGTAVNFCQMVMGNRTLLSGTGIFFTRDSNSGENQAKLNVKFGGQGEDVVSGHYTPKDGKAMAEHEDERIRAVYQKLTDIAKKLEAKYRDMVDIEFTFEEQPDGEIKLYILQTRNGKRTAKAEHVIADDLKNNNVISPEEALLRLDPYRLAALKAPFFTEESVKAAEAKGMLLGKATAASPGAEIGQVVFSSDEAVRLRKENPDYDKFKIVLVTEMTTPEDTAGMHAANAILTSKGGNLSHAALIAKEMSKCCVVGMSEIKFIKDDNKNNIGFKIGEHTFNPMDNIAVDGHSGKIFKPDGKTLVRKVPEGLPKAAEDFLKYADTVPGRMHIRANAQSAEAEKSFEDGAKGIGLYRTEHDFHQESGKKALAVLKTILFSNKSDKDLQGEYDTLYNHYKPGFANTMEVNKGHGVTFRLLDAPQNEFIPKDSDMSPETNPMMGNRSVRMLVQKPQIAHVQIRAALEAACELIKKGIDARPEIEVPLVANLNEIKFIREIYDQELKAARQKYSLDESKFKPKFGIMVETPAAAELGRKVAHMVDFASFGTNDLTQMTLGMSREDAESFLRAYVELGIYPRHPFININPIVLKKMARFIRDAKSVNPNIEIAICGNQAGDPFTINVLHRIGLDIISVSPADILQSRLAAAQAALMFGKNASNFEMQARAARDQFAQLVVNPN